MKFKIRSMAFNLKEIEILSVFRLEIFSFFRLRILIYLLRLLLSYCQELKTNNSRMFKYLEMFSFNLNFTCQIGKNFRIKNISFLIAISGKYLYKPEERPRNEQKLFCSLLEARKS